MRAPPREVQQDWEIYKYSAGQNNVVEGCVRRDFNHTTFGHVFWPAEYVHLRSAIIAKATNNELFFLSII